MYRKEASNLGDGSLAVVISSARRRLGPVVRNTDFVEHDVNSGEFQSDMPGVELEHLG